ncbi:MAG: hypothetical protein K2X93_01885 [Candidatus Obscuribacterales bacterium]|nr:hypothetical protein [Candidatus Obscuribacterales bacterium]
MSQRQFESGADVGNPTSDLTDNPLIKQVILEGKIKQNQAFSQTEKIFRAGEAVGGRAKQVSDSALSNYQQFAPEASGNGMGFGLGVISRPVRYGPRIAASTGGIMTAFWVKNELSGNRWGGFAKSVVESYRSPVNQDSSRRPANKSLRSLAAENTIVMPATAGEFACGAKISPKEWDGRAGRHISAEALALAASLRITGRMEEHTGNLSEALNAFKSRITESQSGSNEDTAELPEPQLKQRQNSKLEPESQTDSTASTTSGGDNRTGELPTVTAAIREVHTLQVVDNTASKVRTPVESVNPAPCPGAVKSKAITPSAQAPEMECTQSIEAEVEKPSISAHAKAKARAIEIAFNDAKRHSESFENQRAQRQAERDIADIETNRKRFLDSNQREASLQEARDRKINADVALKDNSPKYAQTLKKLNEFIRSVEDFAKVETNAASRDSVLRDSVVRVEELMMPIDNIWNGIVGKTADLPRPGAKTPGDRPIWPEERLSQIQTHLEAKINTVDGAQAQRVNIVKDNATFSEIFRLFGEGKLPKEGSLVFFTSDGTLLYQSELKVSPKAYQSRAKDAASAERHANNTPAFIDVSRLQRGHGPEGAGLWRFIGQETRIVGAAVLNPVMRDGKPVELPGARNKHGEPMVKKEVVMVINSAPDGITSNMAYGHMLNTMRAKKIAFDKSANSSSNGESARQASRFSPENRQRMQSEDTNKAAGG